MSILFEQYDLLSQSDLFDSEFYALTNPDIIPLNIDPLMHYLETGCIERRDPSAEFDTLFYLGQCDPSEETPVNALLHYLTVGAARGLLTQQQQANVPAKAEAGLGQEPILFIDVPPTTRNLADAPVHGGLSIAGWTLASGGIDQVKVSVDGRPATVAYLGIRRPDVASAYPNWRGAMQSGFAAHIPPRALKQGRHLVSVTACDRSGQSATRQFSVDVQELSGEGGPWSLRTKISQIQVDLQFAFLDTLSWKPTFQIRVPLLSTDEKCIGVRRTLMALCRQVYPQWQLLLHSPAALRQTQRKALLARCLEGFEEYSGHVRLVDESNDSFGSRDDQFVFMLAPGDEFGCVALLEFAIASGLNRDADLLYCDERRADPLTGKVTAFFKPQWSPDLQLSTNYIGRSWCAKCELVVRAIMEIGDMPASCDYDLILRITETARSIRHVPHLLFQRSEDSIDDVEDERRALSAALKRREIAGVIAPGSANHYYRVKRARAAQARVSIIIPTCGARGLIKQCIESLRDRTAYKNLEIIGVDHIPPDAGRLKEWLGKNADLVVTVGGPFNWSRFNNRGAARAQGSHYVFLNDDIEIIEPDWLEAMLEHSLRPEVGVVGPQLLYPNRSLQHAGVALDEVGRGRHAFRHLQEDDPGYFCLASTQRNVISVTGACLMTRSDVFQRLGRFEEAHAVINGDLDYCLRSWSAGMLNIYTPYARLIHQELASRSGLEEQYNAKLFRRRWRKLIEQGDPYLNPNLSLDHDRVEIQAEPVEEIYAGHPLFAKSSVRRILVVKLDHIGDAITAMPAVRRLKNLFPSAEVTVLAGKGSRPIWTSEPSVDATLEFDFFHVRSGLGAVAVEEDRMTELEATLRDKRFDLGIDLRKQPDTRHILQRSGATFMAGFDHRGRFPWLDVALEWDEDVPLRTKHAHVSDDLNSLIDAVAARSEVPAAPTLNLAKPFRLKRKLPVRLFSRPLVCVHPSAGSELRQWPAAKFAELINMMLAEEIVNVAVIGGEDDRNVAKTVLDGVERGERVFNLVGKTSLADLPGLLLRSALFVGNNSGPQHLAASLGVSTVGIHSGVVDAHEWGPAGPRALAIRRHMSCSPCFMEKVQDCPRSLACLNGLESREVFRRCMRLLRLSLSAAAQRMASSARPAMSPGRPAALPGRRAAPKGAQSGLRRAKPRSFRD